MTFIIDGSGSIEQAGTGNFNLVKNFVKSVIGGFRIGFDQTHVGAVIFSSSQYVKKVFGLETYYNRPALNRAIDDIRYPSGGTYTGKAIRLARTQIYTSSEDREDKPNVAIVITDGKANDDIVGPANALRGAGTSIFAVGVGLDYDRAELERMAGDKRNVYTADFNDLDNVIEQIKQSACRGRFFFSNYSSFLKSEHEANFISAFLRYSICIQNHCKLNNFIQQRFLPFCWG